MTHSIKTRSRRFRIGSLAVTMAALALFIAGCGGASTGGASNAKGGVTLNLLYRSTNTQYDTYMKSVVHAFEKQEHGAIHVNVNSIPDADYHQKVSLVLKGNNPPDLFFSWEGGWAQQMVKDGFAAPLDRYYKQYHWDTSLNAAANKLAAFDGHKWFVPEYMAASAVWYNTALFKKYNLTPPKTWSQLVHVATVFKSHGIAPFLLANQQQWEAQFPWTAYFVNKYGAPVYQQLLDHKIKWTDPRVVATFAEMKQLEDQGWFLHGVNSMDFDGTAIVFWKRQQAAMWYQGSFILSKFLGQDGKLNSPVDWFPFPQIGSTPPTQEMFAENTWMINQASTHKAQAAALLNFIVSKQSQSKLVADVGPYPANKSVSLSSQPPMVQRLGRTMARFKGYTWMHIDHALPPSIATPFLQSLQGVLSGTVTPQTAAQNTEQAASAAMGGA